MPFALAFVIVATMRRTILLADDSPTIQRLVTSTFADADVDIVSVNNGDAAIRKLDEIQPHLVMADIYMPGKNGYEVCAHVRQHPQARLTPVILLVGAFDAFDDQRAKALGATAHITKPFEPQALVTLVETVFQATPEADASAHMAEAAAVSAIVATESESDDQKDLLGLEALFQETPEPATARATMMTESDVDRIADRVIQKISAHAIETISWEIVPDITEKVVREELKKNR
jgi:CheY-like chemotaxis protein